MKIEEVISELKKSSLYAEHSGCGGEFKLSDTILFDGTKPFPEKAKLIQIKLLEELKNQEEELKKSIKRATTGAQITAKAVNVGKLLEKVFPTMKDFKWDLSDCRFLGEPIDFITFDGLERGNIKSIKFVEIKSGNAKLNDHQKSVRDAIEDKKLDSKELK